MKQNFPLVLLIWQEKIISFLWHAIVQEFEGMYIG